MLHKKKLGILGGMGPEATVLLFNKIIKYTNAKKDQDHIEIIIHNNSGIPDRTEAILGDGVSPLNEMSRSAQMLERAGADYIIIPCMTAHYFLPELQKNTLVPIIDAISETTNFVIREYPDLSKIGLIATTGTIKSRLFQNSFKQYGIETIILTDTLQYSLVMEAVYGNKGIKAGFLDKNVRSKLSEAILCLTKLGAKAILAGCTEIPLAIKQDDLTTPFIDPLTITAKIAIHKCLRNNSGDQ